MDLSNLEQLGENELRQHLQTAADNASQAGQPDVASELTGMIERHQVDTGELKDAAINYVRNNPQVVEHFAPEFAQGILGKVL